MPNSNGGADQRAWGTSKEDLRTQRRVCKRRVECPRAPMRGKDMRKSTAGAPKTARSAAGQEQRRRRGARSPPKRRAATFCISPWGWFSIAPADENAQRERQNIPSESRREKARGVDPTLRGGPPRGSQNRFRWINHCSFLVQKRFPQNTLKNISKNMLKSTPK